MNTDSTYDVVGNEQFSSANLGSPGRSEFTTNTIEDLFDLFTIDISQHNVTDDQNPYHAFYKGRVKSFYR